MEPKDGAAALRAWIDRPYDTSKLTGPGTFTATAMSAQNGDVAKVTLAVDLSTGRVREARFKSFSGGQVIGCLSFLSDWAKGRSLDEVGACASLDLPTRFALSPLDHFCAALATDAFAAAAHEARQSLGRLSTTEREAAAAALLGGPPELFDEEGLVGRVESAAVRFASGPPLDWSRVALRVAAAIMGHEGEPDPTTRTLEETLADVRYLDGGLRQDVAARAARVLGARATTTSKGGA